MTPFGYSRRDGKRDVERLVAEELEGDAPSRFSFANGTSQLPHSRVALELGPSELPRSVLDLRAVTRPAAPANPWLQGVRHLQRLGLQLLRFLRPYGERLFRWVSWK
ncbi:MAG TPA: hypothetical protein VF384_04255 [Planctomycetota bacterium]